VKDRRLLVNKTEAAVVRKVFEGFIKTGSATVLVRSLREEGACGKRGRLIDKGYVYQLLNNRVYVGDAVHMLRRHRAESVRPGGTGGGSATEIQRSLNL
jgi:hypothetical protein